MSDTVTNQAVSPEQAAAAAQPDQERDPSLGPNDVSTGPAGEINGTLPIIFLDDVSVVFNTRTGSLLHPNKVQAVKDLTLRLMPGRDPGHRGRVRLRQVHHGQHHVRPAACPRAGHVYFKGEDVTKRSRRRSAGCIGRVDLGGIPGPGHGAERPHVRCTTS